MKWRKNHEKKSALCDRTLKRSAAAGFALFVLKCLIYGKKWQKTEDL